MEDYGFGRGLRSRRGFSRSGCRPQASAFDVWGL